MAKLSWDNLGEKFYETGVDRGVLYLANGSGVSWNGLVSVEEDTSNLTTETSYYDGAKQIQIPAFDDFAATLTAYTYPDEFLDFEGTSVLKTGVYAENQNRKSFSLSYRTMIGNDLSDTTAYKIHILYNLIATPSDILYETFGDTPSALEFSWELKSRPEVVSGYMPTAHVIIDSRYILSSLLSQIEDTLYGSAGSSATLPSLSSLITLVTTSGSAIIVIVDGGDGTWTATASNTYLTMLDATTFQITGINATFLDADTYTASTT